MEPTSDSRILSEAEIRKLNAELIEAIEWRARYQRRIDEITRRLEESGEARLAEISETPQCTGANDGTFPKHPEVKGY